MKFSNLANQTLLQFGRWTALLLGITYGYSRNKFLQRRADKFKEIRDKRKAERLQREATAKAEAFKSKCQFFCYFLLCIFFLNHGIIVRHHSKMIQLVCKIFQNKILELRNIVCKLLIFAAYIYNEKLYTFFFQRKCKILRRLRVSN